MRRWPRSKRCSSPAGSSSALALDVVAAMALPQLFHRLTRRPALRGDNPHQHVLIGIKVRLERTIVGWPEQHERPGIASAQQNLVDPRPGDHMRAQAIAQPQATLSART